MHHRLVVEPSGGSEDQAQLRRLVELESPRAASSLGDAEAVRLVAYALRSWSDWWASKALDWIDQGVGAREISDALASCSRDRRYSQRTRHRAIAHMKSA